ncbi:DNA polymerase epsilon subunit 4 [Bombina bombina]|uniref:DNA polymerase epsilon subunit 4 n=1 Tax=Bombina bombina TaxID=8345 RepID=UPI00235B2758|nr:DNA polymerase epsilon subunit 4 [Bombina bombina]
MAAVGVEPPISGEADSAVEGAAATTTTQADGDPSLAQGIPSAQQKHVKLPLSRVKAIMKADPDVTLASQESVFVITKATELFIETIAKDAYIYAQQGKRKTLQRKDLDNAVFAIDEFAFLEGTLD